MDRLALLLQDEGATVVRWPLVVTSAAEDEGSVRLWLQALAAGRFDRVIFQSAEGVERLLATAQAAGLTASIAGALARTQRVARGPQTARALHSVGISADRCSSGAGMRGLVDCLRRDTLRGAQVGLQLSDGESAAELVEFLGNRGADVFPVAPYRWGPAASDEAIAMLLDSLARNDIDAVVFARRAEIRRLIEVAGAFGRVAGLRAALLGLVVAVSGSANARTLADFGVPTAIVPSRRYFARNTVEAIVQRMRQSE